MKEDKKADLLAFLQDSPYFTKPNDLSTVPDEFKDSNEIEHDMWRLNDTLNFVILHLQERKALDKSQPKQSGKEDFSGVIAYAMSFIEPLARQKAA